METIVGEVDFSRLLGKDCGMGLENQKIERKRRAKRPRGLSIIIAWFGFRAGVWTLVLAIMRLNRFGNWTNEDKELIFELLVGGMVTLSICVCAWLGQKWARYGLAALIVIASLTWISHSLSMASDGKLLDNQAQDLFLKIPFVFLIGFCATIYVLSSSRTKQFFGVTSPQRVGLKHS